MQIELCDHLFQKTTCVEMEMEVRNRNDEKKMNEDEEEESFHNDKLVLFCNLKLRKKSKVKRKSHTDELTQKKNKVIVLILHIWMRMYLCVYICVLVLDSCE